MRYLSPENQAALEQRVLVARDFIYVFAKEFDTGLTVEHGFWSDVGNIAAPVIDPDDGQAVTRNFEGAGTLISIGDLPLVSNLTVRNATLTMSQINDSVEAIVRGHDLKQAPIQIHRGLFSPDTRLLVAPAFCRFVGFVDEIEVTTPKEGEAGTIVLTCASHTQEAMRSNSDTRSNESQKRRDANDNFFQDTTTVGDWEFFWGGKTGKIDTDAKRIDSNVPSSG